MRIWYDTEFIDDGHIIDLISIGMVKEDGRELYLQSSAFDESKASDWVKENVIEHLILCPCCGHKCNHECGKCRHKDCPWRSRAQLAIDIQTFIGEEKVELWGYYSAYDHVALAQLFGPMINLPKTIPMYTMDIKQLCKEKGNPLLPVQKESKHHALYDARWNKIAWEFLQTISS